MHNQKLLSLKKINLFKIDNFVTTNLKYIHFNWIQARLILIFNIQTNKEKNETSNVTTMPFILWCSYNSFYMLNGFLGVWGSKNLTESGKSLTCRSIPKLDRSICMPIKIWNVFKSIFRSWRVVRFT